ncbi:MAG: hypothetical protein AAGC60_28960 [Acidobacteriota bacterium]
MVRLLGLEPVSAPPHAFVLRPDALLYGGFEASPDGFAFEVFRQVVLPEGLFVGGKLGGPAREQSALAAHVGELIGQLPEVPAKASLVVPDDWLRLAFTELAELPARPEQRDEILRWKLKRLVPYRVEDLRLSAIEVTPLDDQDEELRIVLGFAGEMLMRQLEDAFESHGVVLGAITNHTLATLSSLKTVLEPGVLGCLVAVGPTAYTISFALDDEPRLYRFKNVADSGVFADAVARDLRLTASFIDRYFGARARRAFLVAPAEVEPAWLGWMADELGVDPEPLRSDALPLTRGRREVDPLDLAPLLGAASLEVA